MSNINEFDKIFNWAGLSKERHKEECIIDESITNNILNYRYSRKNFQLSLNNYLQMYNINAKFVKKNMSGYYFTFLILLIISQSKRSEYRDPLYSGKHKNKNKRRYEYIKYIVQNITDLDINMPDSNGFTPLSWACRLGLCDIAKLLIDNGADVNKENNARRNPLITTIRSRNFYRHMSEKIILDISKLLINNDIKINNNDYDYSPLYYAVEKKYNSVVKLLLDNDAMFDKKIIINRRFFLNKKNILELMILKYGVNTLNTPNNMGYSLTHYAIQLEKYNIAKVLLKHMDEKLRNIYYISNSHIFSSLYQYEYYCDISDDKLPYFPDYYTYSDYEYDNSDDSDDSDDSDSDSDDSDSESESDSDSD